MKARVILFVLLGLVLLGGQSLYSSAVQPEVATSLALEQFAEPTVKVDVIQRTFGSSSFQWLWLGYTTIGVVTFYKPVLGFFKEDV